MAGPQNQWYKQENLQSATDEYGHPININQITVTGTVNPNQVGTYPLTYSYTDGRGNTYTKTTEVDVVPSQATIVTKDETIIAGPQSHWSTQDTLTKATDENGQPISAIQVSVAGQVQPSTVGTYTITYSYTDGQGNVVTQPATVTVVASQAKIQSQDSTLVAGPKTKWSPEDNFVATQDENGQSISYGNHIGVHGGVNTGKPNIYSVTYSYHDSAGNIVSSTANVTVIASQGEITAKNSTVVAGPNTKWTPGDNFTGATDENGQPVDLSKVTVSGNVDTQTPGSYPVTYTYTDGSGNVFTQTVTITVAANVAPASNANQDSSTGMTTNSASQLVNQDLRRNLIGGTSNQGYEAGSQVNATSQTTSVLPQTGRHQAKSTSQKALEIGLISATFGLILLMKRNKKNGID
ncbi:immunoglobulin-like domain-containing protein [Fructobacillus americanaquae]|uniref:immunoglobulin-like domain-containing protein n=1 Tax=Fructobacillus americanaquae TaxID=2940302 RepID=UPI0030841C00